MNILMNQGTLMMVLLNSCLLYHIVGTVVQVSCVANWPLDFSVHISANYHATLNRYISPDELPVCYGGKRSDPDGDPTCKSQASQTKITPH